MIQQQQPQQRQQHQQPPHHQQQMVAQQRSTTSLTRTTLLPEQSYDLSSHATQQQQQHTRQFACLYTKQKTQKKRKWQDGRLVLKGTRVVLHDANPAPGSGDPSLDETEISGSQCQALLRGDETRLEMDKYLIQVEGPWVPVVSTTMTMIPTKIDQNKSSGMQKILQRKFQKPQAYVPPPPQSRQSHLQAVLGKRRRPLQPGELQRLHYGDAARDQLPPPQHQHQQHQHQPPPRPAEPPIPRHVLQPQESDTRGGGVGPRTQLRDAANQQDPPPTGRNPHYPAPARQPNPYAVGQSSSMSNHVTFSANPQQHPIHDDSAPDAFQLDAPPSSSNNNNNETSSSNTNKAQTNIFWSNEFNATSFYGEEEEEEENDEPPDGNVSAHAHFTPPWDQQQHDYSAPNKERPRPPQEQHSVFSQTFGSDPPPPQEHDSNNNSVFTQTFGSEEDPPPRSQQHQQAPTTVFTTKSADDKFRDAPPSREDQTAASTTARNVTLSGNQLLALFGAFPAESSAAADAVPDATLLSPLPSLQEPATTKMAETARFVEPNNGDGDDKDTTTTAPPPEEETPRFDFVLPSASESSSEEEEASSQEN